MSTPTRFQRLRAKRQSRSAAREFKLLTGALNAPENTSQLQADLDQNQTERYLIRQQKRQVHHLKRNLRKNNPKNRVKIPVYDEVENNRRNILLRITIHRVATMPRELHKKLLRERAELANEHPKSKRQDVPNMSDKRNMPRTGSITTRTQYTTQLADKPLTAKETAKLNTNLIQVVNAGGKRKAGTYQIIGYKKITHAVPFNTQLHG